MGPCSIPSPGAVCAFGFQSILASAGFLRVLRFSLLHLKLDFLNKSVSMHFMEASLKFNAFALLGFAWFPPNVINKLVRSQVIFQTLKSWCKICKLSSQLQFNETCQTIFTTNLKWQNVGICDPTPVNEGPPVFQIRRALGPPALENQGVPSEKANLWARRPLKIQDTC